MLDDAIKARPDASACLDIRPDAYALRLNGQVIARLDGGSAALVPGTSALRDIDIDRQAAADVVLVRELVHHGQLSRVSIEAPCSSAGVARQ